MKNLHLWARFRVEVSRIMLTYFNFKHNKLTYMSDRVDPTMIITQKSWAYLLIDFH